MNGNISEANLPISEIEKLRIENAKLKKEVRELSWDGALNEAEEKIKKLQSNLDLAVEELQVVAEYEILNNRPRRAGQVLVKIREARREINESKA
jgi:hypothetical protein